MQNFYRIFIGATINDYLEQTARAIYKSWFVDFEPLRDGAFVVSELGKIPIGWRIGSLSELVDIKYGKDHKKFPDGTVPVYGSGGFMRHVTSALYDGESVLIPRKGTLNNVIYVNEAFWTVDTMFYTVMKSEGIAKFVFHFVKSQDLASMNAGSAVPSMTTDILNSMPVIIPKADALLSFESVTASMYQSIQANQKENNFLASLRDTLLPKLMSGELSVADI